MYRRRHLSGDGGGEESRVYNSPKAFGELKIIERKTLETDSFLTFIFRGLISSHILAELLQTRKLGMSWYHGELLNLALDVGYR